MPQSSSHFSSNPSLPIGHLSVSAPLGNIPAGMDPARASLNRLQQLIDAIDSTLRLPNSPRAFAVYLLGLVIVFTGAFLHVLVAAQIMQAEFTLAQLKGQYRAIEQQNGDLIFQIARDSNMARLQQEIAKAGYVPVQEREYIFVPYTDAPGDTLAIRDDTIGSGVTGNSITGDDTATEATYAAHAAVTGEATQPALATTLAYTNRASASGQWARWEEFWRSTLGMTARDYTATAPTSAATSLSSSTNSASTSTPNFWAVWWEQASEQGAKLLEQLRGQ